MSGLVKGKKQSYQHFKDTELFNHESMSYVETAFESLVDGEKIGELSENLMPFLQVPSQHRKICHQIKYAINAAAEGHSEALLQSAVPLIYHYQQYGHLSVDLGLFDDLRVSIPAPSISGMLIGTLDQVYQQPEQWWHETLQKMYQSSIGFEFAHTPPKEQQWFTEKIKHMGQPAEAIRLKAYADLYRAEQLEKHLGIQFVGQKRFS